MEMSPLIFLIQFFSQIYAQEQSDNFAEILQPQAILCKYLKGNVQQIIRNNSSSNIL